jgi:tetratricopeptide (TPR) repeat protein
MKRTTSAFTLACASAIYACAIAPTPHQQAFAQQAAPPVAPNVDAILMQNMLHAFEVRTGHFESAEKSVALMDEATKASPGDARLWAGLGTAYFLQANASFGPGGKPVDGLAAIQRASEAHARSLAIDPDNAAALAGHGTTMVILATFQQKPEFREKGIAELDRAVAVSPNNTSVRLQRAFSSINLPPSPARNANAIEDLGYLARLANGMRSGDYVRIMLGDVQFEIGKPDLARKEYEAVAKSERPGGAEARARLAALDKGDPVAPADMARLRQATGSNCMMCHGS